MHPQYGVVPARYVHRRLAGIAFRVHLFKRMIIMSIIFLPIVLVFLNAAGQTSEPAPAAQAPSAAAAASDSTDQKIKGYILDPVDARQIALDQIKKLKEDKNIKENNADLVYYNNVLQNYDTIDRPNKVRLSLTEAIQRALANSYNIRVASYDPAIQSTRIVQAEAAFDTIFATGFNYASNNAPSSSPFAATDSQTNNFQSGLSKRLPTGMTASTVWSYDRTYLANFKYTTLNPSWGQSLTFKLNQPLLRGFGLDYNRSAINIAKLNRNISEHEFKRQVQDHLLNVEQAYWNVVAARRSLVIASNLIAEFQKIYDYLVARSDFDAAPVNISNSRSQLYAQHAQFELVKKAVRDAEDNLKNLLNDPELNLKDDIEIVPTEFPTQEKLVLDPVVELQTALDQREELRSAELAIESAKIQVGVSKNETLPQLDANFSYSFPTLASSFDRSFKDLGDFDYDQYTVGVQFQWPIGNRGPRAALRQSRLQHAQALARLKLAIESVIFDVNVRVRDLFSSYAQISPNAATVESQTAEVQAIVDRAERRDPNTLNLELYARSSLAGAKRDLLNSIVQYNLSIIELERAKGTLLTYDNVNVVNTLSQVESTEPPAPTTGP